MKIDLHCHSKHSKRPSLWLMQKIGCPECFTEPVELYHIALRNGMTAVTITDHNVIDGCLEIAHLPNTFISCEYTAYFPNDDCKVHVLAYGITEAQHRELNRLRENIVDLAGYLQREGIHHVCAHPLYAVNERLTAAHVEKLILLFKNWEWNGELHPDMNAAIEQILARTGPPEIARMVEQHGIEPGFAEPGKKHLTGGSDDHSSLNIAFTYTEVSDAETLEAFWADVNAGRARVCCRPATPQMSARNLYGIAFQFYTSKFGLDHYVYKDRFIRFLYRVLQTRPEPPETWLDWLRSWVPWRHGSDESRLRSGSLLDLARFEAERLILKVPELMGFVDRGDGPVDDLDQKWFEFVAEVSNRVITRQARHVLDLVLGARLFDVFHSIGSAGALYALLSPFFVGFSMYGAQRSFSEKMLDHFVNRPPGRMARSRRVRLAVFSDIFYEHNDLANTLRTQLESARALNRDYTAVTCADATSPDLAGVCRFAPVDTYTLEEYPALKLLAPPFPQMLSRCYEEAFTHLHAATPGPVGLAALGIARILQVPITGTYSIPFPQYAKVITGDTYVEDMLWRYLIWFYGQLDVVYVPSAELGQELLERGFNPDKVRLCPRGIDISHFHPSKRGGLLPEAYGITEDAVSVLYVGRITREKNLPLLAEAYKAVVAKVRNVRLVVTGDGPYREELERELAQTPAIFTGALHGDDLAALYASCDLLAFPSTQPTFGNAVIEAQASGIPVVVAEGGCPPENFLPDETGLLVEANSAAVFAEAMEALIRDSARREAMGRAARAYIETHGFEHAFEQLWSLYTRDRGAQDARFRVDAAATRFSD